MIVFTEEEMLENREEKRNQPNYKKISYKCESCVLGFTRKDTFDQHMKKRHDKNIGKIICKICQSRYNSIKSLEKHRKKHYVVYKCKLCYYKTLEMWSMSNHCRLKHSNDVQGRIHCQQCSVIVGSPDELSEHMQSQHLVQCNQCGDKFKGKHTLRTHKIYECMECKKKFASKVYWRKHCEFYHQRKSQYKCETCNKLFISDWRLKNHRQTQHGLTRSRNHSCNICGKKFFTQSTLRGHQLTHSEERSYMCEDCGDTFKQRPALYTHSRLVHKTRTTTMTTV
ncbi:PREDICTED: zinc finger protein 564-like [Papilio xuthus]|uniref:Zinc finger protein 564-like n=1 Tax=Papilio xuthus TaxID=66420 RepID=A0AAJ7EIP6_PAPXU|nr:PREDICTED: zinc finger protein 564-like [Papilio xuthus]